MEVQLIPNLNVGPIAYADVIDIKSSVQAMTEPGAQIFQDAKKGRGTINCEAQGR